jgi:hypothetical protein
MKTIAQKAEEYIRSINGTGVMWGDGSLLHNIAEYCGIPHEGLKTEDRILNAIDRGHKGVFKKSFVRIHVGMHNRETLVRNFSLIEEDE